MKKIIISVLAAISLVGLAGCATETAVLSEEKEYEITQNIHSLDIEINAADFAIEQGDEFSVVSNLKNLSVSEKDGILKITDETKASAKYNNATLTLYVPEDIVFEDASIITGAGRLTADSLSANTLSLKTGAGMVQFNSLNAYDSVDIKGGAGQINIDDGTLNNLSLNLGVGQLDMTTALLGENDLQFGVGESDLTLIGSEDDYQFEIKNGIGAISIENKTAASFTSNTDGKSYVRVKGGIGATNIDFKE